ncbi:hypothetical protein GCM10007147_03720 [Nocardiopsis kunsanensis]|uniref:N-acetyltransferase domain-containing protein n=2 Tax=Nocardiopsis kunsanensis TaxID=141693 RepID=A0A918X7B9_9ACTN|nr:hypothetical protein GCM10007147_03720 [Nocardiopsis kunsanensis]
MRWIGDGSVRDEQQTHRGIEAMEREWDRQGFGLFAVEIRSTGELAGFTGLSIPDFMPEVLPAVEVGWRLGRAHWGPGRRATRSRGRSSTASQFFTLSTCGTASGPSIHSLPLRSFGWPSHYRPSGGRASIC